ncbi:MAG: hypothetical protein AAGA48_22515 [Myxococcota bacterium]
MRVLFVAALFWPSWAWAQTRPDLEYRDTQVDVVDEENDDRLTVRGFFETHYYEYDNIDFRLLNEDSDQAILDSDDRGAFAFTGAQLEIGYQIDPQVRFVVTGSHRGLWGDDQIGETNRFGGFIYFPALYVDLYSSRTLNRAVRFRVGRQFYTLGGLGPGVRDYVLADVLDMVRIDIPVSDRARFTVLPINVYSTAANYDEVDFVNLIGQQNPETFYFRGDVLTRRFGATFTLDNDEDTVVGGQAYVFYSDLHGRGTGSDISYNGALGNFTDADYLLNYGVRVNADFGAIRPFAEFNGSAGVDRKEEVAQNVNTNGYSWGAGARLDTRREGLKNPGVLAQIRYFEAQGSVHTNNGLLFSHGYVGMKGQHIGGTLLNRFFGLHPTAYTGRNGVINNPQDMSRKSGTRSLELWGNVQLESGFHALGGVWFLQDTGFSDVDFETIDFLEPPFGYSRSEFAATERLGKILGTEIDAEVGWQFGRYVDTFLRGAVVVPGGFYGIPIDRVAGNALGSDNPQFPWAAHGGIRVSF